MKRRILSDNQFPRPEEMLADSVTAFRSAGYELTINDDWTIDCKCTDSEAAMMPKIDVLVNRSEDEDTITFDATLTFPTLDTALFSYYDDTEYYLKKWYTAGKAVTKLMNSNIHLSDYVE